MTAGIIVTIVVLVLLVLLVVAGIGMYNGLIKLRNLVQEAWAQIDTELKRRHDLIGNLVETVKGYAAHEKGVLEAVTNARAGAMQPGQSPAQAAESEAALTQALVRLNAVAEAYPDLKANENFLALQSELTGTEDRIASARRYYNATVRELNTKVETVPTNFVAGFAKITKAEYFEVVGSERDPVKVDFGTGGSTPPPAATPAPEPTPAPAPTAPPTPSPAPEAPPAAPPAQNPPPQA